VKTEIGKRYGRVIIIRKLATKPPPRWLVKCDCGQYEVLSGLHFKKGGWTCCTECWEAGYRNSSYFRMKKEQLASLYEHTNNLYGGHNIDYRDRQDLINDYEEAGLHANWGKLDKIPSTEEICWDGRNYIPDFVPDEEIDKYISSLNMSWADMLHKVDGAREEIATKQRMTRILNKFKKIILG